MKPIAAVLLAAGLIAALPAEANLDLAKKSNCITCHQTDKKLLGPSFQDIAKKYAGDKNAVKPLVTKIRTGGKGVWGQVPMPPSTNVKDADIETLVKLVLAGAK